MPTNRDFALVTQLSGVLPDQAVQSLQVILTRIFDLNDRINTLPTRDTKPPTMGEIIAGIEQSKALNVSQFLGVLAQPQNAAIPEVETLPDVNDPLSQEGGVVRLNGALYIFDSNPEPGEWVLLGTAASVSLTGQSGSIAATGFDNTAGSGTFRLSWYLEVTTADPALSSVQLRVNYVDDAGDTNITSDALSTVVRGRTFGSVFLRKAGGSMTYQVDVLGSLTAGRYAIFIALERLS